MKKLLFAFFCGFISAAMIWQAVKVSAQDPGGSDAFRCKFNRFGNCVMGNPPCPESNPNCCKKLNLDCGCVTNTATECAELT